MTSHEFIDRYDNTLSFHHHLLILCQCLLPTSASCPTPLTMMELIRLSGDLWPAAHSYSSCCLPGKVGVLHCYILSCIGSCTSSHGYRRRVFNGRRRRGNCFLFLWRLAHQPPSRSALPEQRTKPSTVAVGLGLSQLVFRNWSRVLDGRVFHLAFTLV